MNTKQSRIRRSRKTRAKIAAVKAIRLSINRTNSHIYAQIISADGGTVMTSVSSNDKEMRAQLPNGGNVGAATVVGKRLAEKAKGLGIWLKQPAKAVWYFNEADPRWPVQHLIVTKSAAMACVRR
ncbi:MAG: 50S ribosomal protein L18 [Hydrogenophilales bacterium 16-61-112]|nr:MAG: 50S ribosomal protein L18 [Hydrogenophilales bacterium 16-61-112]